MSNIYKIKKNKYIYSLINKCNYLIILYIKDNIPRQYKYVKYLSKKYRQITFAIVDINNLEINENYLKISDIDNDYLEIDNDYEIPYYAIYINKEKYANVKDNYNTLMEDIINKILSHS